MGNPRSRRKALLCKTEPIASYGTDAVPTAADNPARAIDIGEITKEYNSQEIRTHDVATYVKAIAGMKYATINFKLYLTRASSNGILHMLSILLKSCYWSHSSSTVNQFDTIGEPDAANSSATIYLYNDGLLEKITGARGTAKFHIEGGKVPYVEFTMTGLYASVSATSLPTISAANYAEGEIFTAAANTLTIATVNYHSYILEFTDGNTVNPIPSCTDTNGVVLIGIPESAPQGNIHYLGDTTTAATIEALIDNSTESAIAFENTDYPNLAISFNASFKSRPIADVEGYMAWDLPFVITGSVSANLSKPA